MYILTDIEEAKMYALECAVSMERTKFLHNQEENVDVEAIFLVFLIF